jgi:hypothetical protein
VRSISVAEEKQGRSIFLLSPLRRLKPMRKLAAELQPTADALASHNNSTLGMG